MTIAFVHENKAILPELAAYIDIFSRFGIKCITVNSKEIAHSPCDVEWRFMGTHRSRSKGEVILIHEYASASTPPFSHLKDFAKRKLNCKPDYRIFNNSFIEKKYQFNDGVPSGIRDYGIPGNISKPIDSNRQYDFIYVGTVDKSRKVNLLFDCFSIGKMKDRTLLVLSKDYAEMRDHYHQAPNIHFKGPVPQSEVYHFIHQSRYGINFMPDISPYNKQTSAKLVDYCACGIPVVSSEYEWVKKFENENGGRFFYFKSDFSNFIWEEMISYSYKIPNVEGWTWEQQLEKSGILSFLKFKFADLSF